MNFSLQYGKFKHTTRPITELDCLQDENLQAVDKFADVHVQSRKLDFIQMYNASTKIQGSALLF